MLDAPRCRILCVSSVSYCRLCLYGGGGSRVNTHGYVSDLPSCLFSLIFTVNYSSRYRACCRDYLWMYRLILGWSMYVSLRGHTYYLCVYWFHQFLTATRKLCRAKVPWSLTYIDIHFVCRSAIARSTESAGEWKRTSQRI